MAEKERKQSAEEERLEENAPASEEETRKEGERSEESELEACRKELEEYKDKYLRAHADFENMKKRLEKDKATAVAFANEAFAIDLLSVIDSFESALMSMEQIEGDEAVDKIKEGVALTYEQLLKVLKKHGVEEIENEGVFDPHVHQVVQQVESEAHEKNEIVQVLQKGYKLRDRVLRPSMVSTKK
ncbi:nucleotide exchange factor GrpE [Nitratifractor sp.]